MDEDRDHAASPQRDQIAREILDLTDEQSYEEWKSWRYGWVTKGLMTDIDYAYMGNAWGRQFYHEREAWNAFKESKGWLSRSDKE